MTRPRPRRADYTVNVLLAMAAADALTLVICALLWMWST